MVHRYPKSYEKSFAIHPKSKFLSNKNNWKADEYCITSSEIVIFKCDKCPHEFASILYNITKNDRWCPFCTNQKLCLSDNCAMCYNNSFASSDMVKYWSISNESIPREIFKSSGKKFLFKCDQCYHEFMSQLNSIKKGHWCGYCSGRNVCGIESCIPCYNRSFASNLKSIYWSDRNSDLPINYTISSDLKKWFVCENKHLFEIRLADITSGQWCSKCKNKTEKKLYNYLIKNYKTSSEQKFNWCSGIRNKLLPFDFLLEEKKIIIELDGFQHFKDVSHWNSLVIEQIKNDKFKMMCALRQGYKFIRIYQPDILFDKLDWKTILDNAIEQQNNWRLLYIASDLNIYENHSITKIEFHVLTQFYQI